MMSLSCPWRLELFYKNEVELGRVIELLKANNIRRVNIPNKNKGDPLLENVRALRTAIPDIDICVHYSIKQNYQRGLDPSFSKFEAFCAELDGEDQVSLLLVSGGGQKKKLNTVNTLQMLARRPAIAIGTPIYVAFNPYLPGEDDYKEECHRLKLKLATGLVQGVYLQIGTDRKRLDMGLKYLGDALSEAMPKDAERPPVFGSVLYPTKRLIAQMRYRPWSGVFLSDEYLSGVPSAMDITRDILRVYSAHGVTPLLESNMQSAAELRAAYELLEAWETHSEKAC